MNDTNEEMVQVPRAVIEDTLATIYTFRARLDESAALVAKRFEEHSLKQTGLMLDAVQTIIEAIPSVIRREVPSAPAHAVEAITVAIIEHANARLAAVRAAQQFIEEPPI